MQNVGFSQIWSHNYEGDKILHVHTHNRIVKFSQIQQVTYTQRLLIQPHMTIYHYVHMYKSITKLPDNLPEMFIGRILGHAQRGTSFLLQRHQLS